jgi:hypothetical protein
MLKHAESVGTGDGRDFLAVLVVDTAAVAFFVVDGVGAVLADNLDVAGTGVAVVQAEAFSHVLIVGVGFLSVSSAEEVIF